jgi:hypothetical protein
MPNPSRFRTGTLFTRIVTRAHRQVMSTECVISPLCNGPIHALGLPKSMVPEDLMLQDAAILGGTKCLKAIHGTGIDFLSYSHVATTRCCWQNRQKYPQCKK